MKKTIGWATILTLALVGCGGGGDGAPSTSQPTTPTTPNTASIQYNECTSPTAMTLPTGYSRHMVYAMLNASDVVGELVTDELFNGPVVFEGQTAIQLTYNSTINTFATATMPASSTVGHELHYYNIQNNGLVVILGVDAVYTSSVGGIPSFTTQSKYVYSKEELAKYLTLKLGESIDTATVGTRTKTTLPIGNAPSTTTTTPINFSTNYTYAARETLTVAGRSFDTCKYTATGGEESQIIHMWVLIGNGSMLKNETIFANGDHIELQFKSGTYNGSAL